MKSASCLVLALFLGACAGGGRGVPPAPPAPGPSEGCKAPLAPGALTLETTVDGATRSYLLVIPEAQSASTSTSPEPLALVFGFHGQSWTADAFRAGGGGPESISGGQAVFVYPNGQPRVGGRGWDLDLDGSDIAFFDIMLREVLSKTCVDTTRIFAFGRSYGAYFVNTLKCARGQLLRGWRR
jgi:polyhydroxybutyrate depolymerase